MIGLTMAGLMLVMVVAFVIFGLNTTDPEPERDAAGYPPQAKIDFMAGCEGAEEETELFGESATDVCECLFTEIQKDLTYQEFLQYSVEAFDNDLGEFEDDLIEWTSTCLEGVDFGS